MPKVRIVPVATILAGAMVLIVTIASLTISYFVVFGSMRDVGQVTAEALAQNSVMKIDTYFKRPLEDGKTAQSFIGRSNYPLPSDDDPETWRFKWTRELDNIMVGFNHSYNSLAFLFTDNTLARMYSIGGSVAAVCDDPRDYPTTGKMRKFVDQFNIANNSESFLQISLPAPPNFWSTSPVVNLTRSRSNNFEVNGRAYYMNTAHLVVTPKGAEVIASTHVALHNSSKHLLGALAVNHGVTQIDSFLESATGTVNTEVFVVRDTGSIVATTHPQKSPEQTLLTSDYDRSQPKPPECLLPDWDNVPSEKWFMTCQVLASQHQFAPLRQFYNTKAYNDTTTGKLLFNKVEVDGEMYYVVSQKLEYPYASFVILLVMPEEDILKEVVTARDLSIAVSAILAAACCIIIAATLHILLRPLSEMCTRLSDTAHLRLEPSNKVSSKPSPVREIFDLQSAYLEMVGQLALVKRFVPHSMLCDVGQDLEEFSSIGNSNTTRDENAGQLSSWNENSDSAVASNPLEGIQAHLSNTSALVSVQDQDQSLPTVDQVVSRKALGASVNKFHTRDCSILCVAMPSLPSKKGRHGMEILASEYLWRIINAVQQNNGVVDQLRPDVFVATFNAHSRCVVHRQLAVKTALTIAWVVQHELSLEFGNARCGIAVDAGEHLVGACGSNEQRATTVLGSAFDTITKLAMIARDRYRCNVLVTDVVTKGLTSAVCINPMDVLEVNKKPKVVYDVTPEIVNGIELFKKIFGSIRRGEVSSDVNQAATDLAVTTAASTVETRLRAQLLLCLVDSVAARQKPHVREYFTHAWQMSEVEIDLISRFAEESETSGAAGGGSSHGTTLSGGGESLVVEQGRSKADQHKDMEDQLREKMEFKAITDDSSLFPMFHQPGTAAGTSEFPEVLVDANEMSWTVSKKKLGKGASGAVLLGLGEDGSLAALKFVPIFDGIVSTPEELQHEVITLSELTHDNVTHYVSCSISENYYVLITEYISGGSLADAIKIFPSFPENLLKRYAIEMLEGLAYLHSKSIVHCDLKPHNVLLTSEGSCKLVDFGSAVTRKTTKNSEGINVRGTAWYMAPEVARGASLNFAADMWSFGVTMLTLNLGVLPWARMNGANTPDRFMIALGKNEVRLDYDKTKVCNTVQAIADACLVPEKERLSAAQLLSKIA